MRGLRTPFVLIVDRSSALMRRRLVAVVGTCAWLVTVPTLAAPPKKTLIPLVPGVGMGEARVGDTALALVLRGGRIVAVQQPRSIGKTLTNEASAVHILQLSGGIEAVAVAGRITSLHTTSTRIRSNRAVGVGSTMKQLRRAYPKIRCTKPIQNMPRMCFLRSTKAGSYVHTYFQFKDSKVMAVGMNGTVG